MRFGPYLYSILHSPEMIWELLELRSERRTAAADELRLASAFPFLCRAAYPALASAARQQLSDAYAEYTSTVSPAPIALSLPLATFLAVVCDRLRPRAILDLGSGFSSYVFRAYAQQSGAPGAVVHSVDESRVWLDRTRAFLNRRRVAADGLSTWEELQSTPRPAFDLILQDFATLDARLSMMDLVLAACRPGGMIVIDDMHVPHYRRAVIKELERRALTYFSLRAFTRRRLRYAYLVLR